MNALYYLIPIAMAAVALVLALGIFNLFMGGSPSVSQKLMRWRVGLQFAALCLIMAAIYLLS
jgi:hypothetical protein